MLGSLLTFLFVGLVTVIVASIALSLIGAAIGLVMFLAFKVAPILLVGWIVVKIFDKKKRQDSLSEADRRWLEGE